MGTTGTGDAEQTDNSKAIGFDAYNQCSTGNVTKTLSNRATDSDHIPIVFRVRKRAFNQLSQSSVYKETEQSVALTVCGGTYGGGSECLIVEKK